MFIYSGEHSVAHPFKFTSDINLYHCLYSTCGFCMCLNTNKYQIYVVLMRSNSRTIVLNKFRINFKSSDNLYFIYTSMINQFCTTIVGNIQDCQLMVQVNIP